MKKEKSEAEMQIKQRDFLVKELSGEVEIAKKRRDEEAFIMKQKDIEIENLKRDCFAQQEDLKRQKEKKENLKQ
jgi:hypothetical protein